MNRRNGAQDGACNSGDDIRDSRRSCRGCLLWLAVAFLLIAVATAGWDDALGAAGRWLDVGQPVGRADYVFVLPGDENCRPFVAAALVRSGYARRAIVPTNLPPPEVRDEILPPTHEVIRRVLLARGVAEDDILTLPGATTSTLEDLASLSEFLAARPTSHALIVTNDYHTRRTRWLTARVLGDRMRRVSFVSAPTDTFQLDHWWQTEQGFSMVVGEYLKLAYYALRSWQAIACLVLGVVLSLVVVMGKMSTYPLR